jgi:hypothetical protein
MEDEETLTAKPLFGAQRPAQAPCESLVMVLITTTQNIDPWPALTNGLTQNRPAITGIICVESRWKFAATASGS